MVKYNLDKLVKVVVSNITPSTWYSYRKGRKFLGIIFENEGVYGFLNGFIGLEAPENHIIKDCTIYKKPSVCLHYQADHSKTYYFDTYQEAKNFASELTNDRKWIS